MRRSMYMWSMTSSSPSSCTVCDVSVSSSSSRSGAKRAFGNLTSLNSCASTSRPARSCLKTRSYFSQHVLAQDVLLGGKLVADQLEDDVERGQREAHHHQALLAGGQHELVVRMLQVAEQLAVALGLALLGPAEHREQFAHRLARQDRLQELDDLAHVREVDVEVRAREAEQHADRALVEHDRVDDHAAVVVAQRDDERQRPAAADDAPDEIGARHLVEDFLDDLELLDGAPFDAAFERRLQLVGDSLHAQLEVAVRRAEAEVRQQFLDQQLQRRRD